MSDKNENKGPRADRSTAKGKGEGGFNPHPDYKDDKEFQDEDLAKKQAREVTPAGKARSK